jgi:hypothetical protein
VATFKRSSFINLQKVERQAGELRELRKRVNELPHLALCDPALFADARVVAGLAL